jgi:uncharacterized membrane protein
MDRVWEIDYIRGIALVMMIIFHFVFDLREFYGYKISYDSGVIYYIGKVSAITFMLVSAISCSFSHDNNRRAIKLLATAALITIVTHLYDKQFGIKFGILHFLGICILLYPLLNKINSYVLAILATGAMLLGNYFDPLPIKHNYLFLFNLTSGSWVSVDYYPLLPWAGVFIFGIILSRMLYPNKRSLFSYWPKFRPVTYTGRHTLWIYLIHQPVLLLLIGAVKEVISGKG